MPRLPTVTLVLSLALAGCGAPGPQFPPACPALSLLKDAADLSRYVGDARDLRGLALQARITAVPATCTWAAGATQVRATLQVAFDMTRGPAATDRRAAVPYFVAVTEGERVLDEQDYSLNAAFPSNDDHALFSGDTVRMMLPVSASKSAAAYHIYVGFRLSPQELSANRQQGSGNPLGGS
jgi:hypothetical protein